MVVGLKGFFERGSHSMNLRKLIFEWCMWPQISGQRYDDEGGDWNNLWEYILRGYCGRRLG